MMSMTNNNLSILTVNYNSTNKLNYLLKSLRYLENSINEIIIIDNNSKDINKLKYKNKKMRLIKNKTNVGFAKAVNQGIKISKNEIILLLNPDCFLTDPSPLKSYNKILKNKNIGILGGSINYPNSTKEHFTATTKPNFFTGLFEFTNLKKIFPNNYFTNTFWIEKNNKITKPVKVFSLCGAYLFIRKRGKKYINYFNDKYFLYLEDLDFGYVIENNGQFAIFDPNSHVNHTGGSSNNSIYKTVLNHWYNSRKIFFLKNLPKFLGVILYIIYSLEEFLLRMYHKIDNTPNA